MPVKALDTAALGRAGFPVRLEEPLGGCTRVVVDDPSGDRIELMEPNPRRS
jgi:hypothetical protein